MEEKAERIRELEEEIKTAKKNKNKNKNLYQLEKEMEECVFALQKYNQEREFVEKKVYSINLQYLTLSCSLLYLIRVDSDDLLIFPTIFGLIQNHVVPSLEISNQVLQAFAIKSFAMFLLMNRKSANDFISVMIEIIQKYEEAENQALQMKELVTLKCVIDYLLLYPPNGQDEISRAKDIQDMVMR